MKIDKENKKREYIMESKKNKIILTHVKQNLRTK